MVPTINYIKCLEWVSIYILLDELLCFRGQGCILSNQPLSSIDDTLLSTASVTLIVTGETRLSSDCKDAQN
jgi:hypothetical protein